MKFKKKIIMSNILISVIDLNAQYLIVMCTDFFLLIHKIFK